MEFSLVNNKSFSNALLLTALLCISGGASAKCLQPVYPDFPEIETAVLAQVIKADKDAKKYVSRAEDYLRCSRDRTRKMQVKYEMKQIRKQHKDFVKLYKERMRAEKMVAQSTS